MDVDVLDSVVPPQTKSQILTVCWYSCLRSRYASLFFCFGIDWNDNELSGLEVLHKYVECLDQYFGNVCELDIIYNYSAVSPSTCHHSEQNN